MEKIALVEDELKKLEADVKWVEPGNIHLTLKFLGEISDEQAVQVKGILDKIAAGFNPFEITLSGIGGFPKLDYPRVIWVGIDKGRKETAEIAKRIEAELEKTGFEKEERPFTAHLTIGRVRSPQTKEALKEKLTSLSQRPPAYNGLSVKIDAVRLYQSKLSGNGAVYTPLHAAGLKLKPVR